MMATLKSKNNLVWMDLEMTGLEPEEERIIEIATVITDNQLHILAEGPSLVIHQSPSVLKRMDAWNLKHHKKSGLLEEVAASKVSVKEAEEKTLEFVKEYCILKKSPLCGNSVHHDRRFLIKYMPKLNDYLHYRLIDVSTVKFLVKGWYPKDKNQPKKKKNHRALQDVRESIEELEYYRKHYFKQLEPVAP